MITIVQGKRVFKIYADRVPLRDVFGFSYYTAFRGSTFAPMHHFRKKTITIDLSRSEEEIFSAYKSNTRNEVRRAAREGHLFEQSCTEEFVPFYNAFAKEKKLGQISEKDITQYPECLIFKSVHEGRTLSMHANLVDRETGTVRLLYSCSERLESGADTKAIGLSNRYLHHMELLRFKQDGFKTYDFAGINEDPAAVEQYRITQFKKCFGGKVEDVLFLTSLPAWIYDSLSRLKNIFHFLHRSDRR